MSQIIIYPNDTGNLALIIPALDCGLTIEDIARKDVPDGKPYKFMAASAVPEDRAFFAAWEADFSVPDGYGIGHDKWFAEQAAKGKA
jgi:hypothetical protein